MDTYIKTKCCCCGKKFEADDPKQDMCEECIGEMAEFLAIPEKPKKDWSDYNIYLM